jgi:hypothetical protein
LPAIAEIDLVTFADSPEGFAQAIVTARQQNSADKITRRVTEAKQHTWEDRLKSFDEVLERVYHEKSEPTGD